MRTVRFPLRSNFLMLCLCGFLAAAESRADWTGNMVRNPGFEEDFVNAHAEGHVLSFKGDWYYNQRDLVPDYWELKGGWTWTKQGHLGRGLKLDDKATASQSFVRAISQEGGGAWGGSVTPALPIDKDEIEKFAQPWKVSVWCRGGTVAVQCGKDAVTGKPAKDGEWELVTVELPVEKIGTPTANAVVTLTGPGEFDDVTVEEKRSDAPNLAANAGFEQLDPQGYPVGWSKQKKYRAIGPTYYVWTDWNHCFRENRGPVASDGLVMRTGSRSLRFDVFPGDEKLVETDSIALNQDKYHVIEAGVWVRADRIRLVDIRCVDQDGDYMPAFRPVQPEYSTGGSALFGNGTFGWRYIRKFFGSLEGKPLKAFRVQLCARGMNGHTLDDADTRSFSMSVGTVWWDDLHVCERTTNGGALAARGVKVPNAAATVNGPIRQPELDLGQRFFGRNEFTYSFFNGGAAGSFSLEVTTKLPDGEPVTTKSAAVTVAANATGKLVAPYTIDRLAGEFDKQGSLAVRLLRNGKPEQESTYTFNTWPVVVDFDVSRHYNLPSENPVTVSMNLGVADATLAQTAKVELQLFRPADKKVLGTYSTTNLTQAFAETLAGLPAKSADSFEFNLPKPDFWVDKTNLLIRKVDLSPLKIWPHNLPTRDTVLVVRGLDAAGKELFRDASEPFCRCEAPPTQPPVKTVDVRDDGAVLINGQPRFLTGATHQHNRMNHTVPIMAQLGVMGHRLSQQMTFKQHEEMWANHKLYALQAKPGNKIGGTVPVIDLTQEQRQELEAFVAAGGLQNVLSWNTGGWEATINPDDAAAVAKHEATHDYLRKLANRPLAISTSGAFNAWWLPKLTWYDINHAETEMWGPMDFNVIWTPYMKRARKTPTAWVYLPQLYDNTPYERYRFETYENIIRGSAGVSMIQGIGDPTFNRGLAGELRYLDAPLNSREPAPAVTLEPNISHKVTRHQGKTYILATNAGPVQVGDWKWDTEVKHSGNASHDGDSSNPMWFRPAGIRIHGFRGLPLPELVQKGDKLVQYVWLDPKETPAWAMFCVRGDGRFAHNGVVGAFSFDKFKADMGNVLMYSELNHSVWHESNWVMDDATHAKALKILGPAEANQIKKGADAGRAKIDAIAYQAPNFHNLGPLPVTGQWHRLELDAEKSGLVGKLVDGFAYLTQNGRALWDYSVLERGGQPVRVFCEDTVGIDRSLLPAVKISVPGLKKGTAIRPLFEDRTITADDGFFVDNFVGTDSYGLEADGVIGDLFGFVKDPDRVLARMIPSGYGYRYGPTAVHIYEISQ